MLFSQRLEYPVIEKNLSRKEWFEHQLTFMIDKMVEKCGGIRVLGVGVALPGIVESNGHIVRECWTHELKECDFSKLSQDTFPFPVVFENDANACVQKYLWDGAEEKQDNFIYLLAREYPQEIVPPDVPHLGLGLD